MKKVLRFFLAGTVAVYMAVSPLLSTTVYAAEPVVTTKSYDMDEYLNMLVRTGQWDRYEKFAKIANADSWAKHAAWYQTWLNGDAVYYGTDPLSLLVAKADVYGFDANEDVFRLLAQNDNRALVRVMHDDQRYYVVLDRNSNGYWYVNHIYQVK